MNNLVPLFEEALEFQNFNGSVLSNGKIKVYFIGRTSLADIYNDVAGEYPSENPKILDNLGMGPIYVNPAFDYEIVVYDEYDNELFSVKKYLHSSGAHSTSNVEVVPSENIQVSAWTQGDVQVYMPYITGNLGKVYSGVEPIIVNNEEDKISANHVPLGVQEPLYFVEDSESACIIGCSTQSEIPSAISGKWEEASNVVIENSAQWEIPEGTMNESAFSYDASSNITAYNGSAFKAGDEFPESATEAINVVTANSAKWNSAYITKGQSNYNGLYSLAQGLNNSAKDYSLAQGGYNTAGGHSLAQGEYNSAEDHSLAQGIWNSARNGSIAQGDHNYANNHSQAFGQYTIATNHGMAIGQFNLTQSAAFAIGNGTYTARSDAFVIDHSGNVSSQGDISASGVSLTSFYTDYQTNSANFITALPEDLVYTGDLNDYAKKDFVLSSIDSSTSALLPTSSFSSVSASFLTALPSDLVYTADITGLATTAQLSEKLDSTAFSTVSGDFLTAVDLTPYQTTAGMTAYMTTADSAQFITALPADLVYTADITGFATTADLTSKLDKSDSANFYTTANESGFITGIPNEVTEAASTVVSNSANWNSTYETVSTNSASWTGGDVPEGVMVESGLEYNAVNEISGYNGSAIAQYGAEKQWLVHDDTLVHAANSAQYALGVNLSALQRLMGIDETVLWSGNIAGSGATLTLNESYTNFDKVAIYTRGVYQPNPLISTFKISDTDSFRLSTPSLDGGSYYNWIVNLIFTGISGSLVRSFVISESLTSTTRTVTNGSTAGGTPVSLEKIIGIGRKA